MERGVHAQGKKNYYMIFFNFLILFIFCMYIRDDVNRLTPLMRSLDPPLLISI